MYKKAETDLGNASDTSDTQQELDDLSPGMMDQGDAQAQQGAESLAEQLLADFNQEVKSKSSKKNAGPKIPPETLAVQKMALT